MAVIAICVSIQGLPESTSSESQMEDTVASVRSHCEALKACMLLLDEACSQAQSEDKKRPAKSAAVGEGARGSKKQQAAAAAASSWNWVDSLHGVVKALANLAFVDLWRIFSPSDPDAIFLHRWNSMVWTLFLHLTYPFRAPSNSSWILD